MFEYICSSQHQIYFNFDISWPENDNNFDDNIFLKTQISANYDFYLKFDYYNSILQLLEPKYQFAYLLWSHFNKSTIQTNLIERDEQINYLVSEYLGGKKHFLKKTY